MSAAIASAAASVVEGLVEAFLVSEEDRKRAEAVAVARMKAALPDLTSGYHDAKKELDELERRILTPVPDTDPSPE